MEEDEKIAALIAKKGLSLGEVKSLLASSEMASSRPKHAIPYEHYSTGKHIKIGVISDTHIGQKEFREDLLKHAGKVFERDKVRKVYHCGDILEGMSGRPGHVYELSHIGFQEQIEYAGELFNRYLKNVKVFGINGNHDLWYAKMNNGGMDVAAELALRVPHFTNLGSEEADVDLGNNILMKVFHPGDGTAYATSYKLQKLIESFDGGKKPNIVIEGHYHKALYAFIRNVHGFEAGTLCGQTSWMRGKKIPAHMGFWVLDIEKCGGRKGGIGGLESKFYTAYD